MQLLLFCIFGKVRWSLPWGYGIGGRGGGGFVIIQLLLESFYFLFQFRTQVGFLLQFGFETGDYALQPVYFFVFI